jgi:hypothetical protein
MTSEERKMVNENVTNSASGAYEMASRFSSQMLTQASKTIMGQNPTRNMKNRGISLQNQITMNGVKFQVQSGNN